MAELGQHFESLEDDSLAFLRGLQYSPGDPLRFPGGDGLESVDEVTGVPASLVPD